MTGSVWDELPTGRKEIITYLKRYVGLSPDYRTAWEMVRRWKKKFGLIVRTKPSNGKPYIVPDEVEVWWLEWGYTIMTDNKKWRIENEGNKV